MTKQRDTLLRRALTGNAIFTLLCVSLILGRGGPLATAMGLSVPWPLTLVGVGLVPFALGVAWNARRPRIHMPLALLTSLGDFGWVIGSAVLLVGWSGLFSPLGVQLVSAVAVAVGAFGIAQLLGVRAIVRNDRPTAKDTLAAEFTRDISSSAETAWPIVSDVHDYAEYAPTLTFSRVLDGAGVGTVRECGDGSGRWTETCTAWDEGRSYRFRVHADAEDYPYPFRSLGGEWRVEPTPRGARITMRFELTPKGGLIGELMTAAMLPKFSAGAEAILDNWEHAILDSHDRSQLRIAG